MLNWRSRSTKGTFRNSTQNGTNNLREFKILCNYYTLDIKNAFNAVNWKNVLKPLDGFLSHHTLQYSTEADVRGHRLTGGVPFISVLATTLWNSMYDDILQLTLSNGASIVGYVDDFALFIVNNWNNVLKPLDGFFQSSYTAVQYRSGC